MCGNFPWLIITILAIGFVGGGILGGLSETRIGDFAKEDNSSEYQEISPGSEAPSKLTVGDRIKNVAIGATLGVAGAGLLLVSIGTGVSLVAGYAGVTIAGATATQTVAFGCLAYNIFLMVVAPFLNMEVDALELG